MFWLACEELKKETNKTVVEEKVRQIYEDFISILSPKEVSNQGCVLQRTIRGMFSFIPELSDTPSYQPKWSIFEILEMRLKMNC